MLSPLHVLVTGANGFVGRHLCRALSSAGLKVSCMGRSANFGDNYHAIDLLNGVELGRVFDLLQPDFVVHLAASKNRSQDPAEWRAIYEVNLSTSLNVIDACHRLKHFRRLIFLGSCDEYGLTELPYDETQKPEPTAAYGLSKLAVTQVLATLFQTYKFPSVVLRPSVIYGPGQGNEMFLAALIQSLLAGELFPMTLGEQQRDFIYVSDLVSAIVNTIHAGEAANGKVINLGAGVSYQIKEVAAMLERLVGKEEKGLVQYGAVPYRSHEIMHYAVSIGRAQKLLGWLPETDLMRGLEQTVQHYIQDALGRRCLDCE